MKNQPAAENRTRGSFRVHRREPGVGSSACSAAGSAMIPRTRNKAFVTASQYEGEWK
jgi:hypothetical protein